MMNDDPGAALAGGVAAVAGLIVLVLGAVALRRSGIVVRVLLQSP
jgi:hypothetical protein